MVGCFKQLLNNPVSLFKIEKVQQRIFAGELNEDEFVRGCLRDESLASLLNGSAQ